VVIPAFNEAPNLPILHRRLTDALRGETYEIIVVDDGSDDGTQDVLQTLAKQDPHLRYLCFSRNFGHQAALRAGLEASRGDCAISLDADGQHPPELIPALIAKWRDEQYRIVATLRIDEGGENTWLKRQTSHGFYALLNAISDTHIEPGSADFRLLDRVVVNEIRRFGEADLFLRGLVPWLGFRTAAISYVPERRIHGRSKYRLTKMLALAASGVMAHSIHPLRVSTILASIVAALTLAYGFYAFALHMLTNRAIPGWTSVVLVLSVLGAMQLLVLGIIGEYLGRVLREVRRRPHYIVESSNIGNGDAVADALPDPDDRPGSRSART
jgi:dolichol-phosphate mannosyltransferase